MQLLYLAYTLNPITREYMIASHTSAEPGTQKALEILKLSTSIKYGYEIR